MRSDSVFRIAVDIGGPFPDCVVLAQRGRRLTTKALTTPEDPAEGARSRAGLAAPPDLSWIPAPRWITLPAPTVATMCCMNEQQEEQRWQKRRR